MLRRIGEERVQPGAGLAGRAATGGLGGDRPPASARRAFAGGSDGLTFLTAPLDRELTVVGPSAARLHVSSSGDEVDVFVVLWLFAPDLREVTFPGANDPHTPLAFGWLRASHRKLDPERSSDNQPLHAHDEVSPVEPGVVYPLDVEIWSTCMVAPAGYRLGLSVRGRDYEYPGDLAGASSPSGQPLTGVGPFRHVDEEDRPLGAYETVLTLYAGPDADSHLLLPVVPPGEPT